MKVKKKVRWLGVVFGSVILLNSLIQCTSADQNQGTSNRAVGVVGTSAIDDEMVLNYSKKKQEEERIKTMKVPVGEQVKSKEENIRYFIYSVTQGTRSQCLTYRSNIEMMLLSKKVPTTSLAILYGENPNQSGMDAITSCKVGYLVEKEIAIEDPSILVEPVPAGEFVYAHYNGIDTIAETYDNQYQWIEKNSYQWKYPVIEIFMLQGVSYPIIPPTTAQAPEASDDMLKSVEVQIPITAIKKDPPEGESSEKGKTPAKNN